MTSGETPYLRDDLEALLATMARNFAYEGEALLVAILADAKPSLDCYDSWEATRAYYSDHITWILELEIPVKLYAQLGDKRKDCESKLLAVAQDLTRNYPEDSIKAVSINTPLVETHNWREKAKVWVAGGDVNNQGRVRSDNIASRQEDGLLFRSKEEILFYKALKSLGISFAPLPVFVKGGENYRRIEPDFIIIKDGIVLVVEVDGDTVHHETPAEAHNRTTMLVHEGAHLERIKASDCNTPEKAKIKAKEMLQVIEQIKKARS